MDISDQELFDSATTDDVIEEAVVQAEVLGSDSGDVGETQPRDESGRFAAKQAEAAAVAQAEGQQPPAAEQPEDAQVPSWRMRELREERDAAVRRSQDAEADFRRQIAELQQRIPAKPQEPPKSFYESDDPNAFIAEQAKSAVDPVVSQVTQMKDFFSRREAEREHGAEKVKAAFDWIAQGVSSRDPEAVAVYQRAMGSMHPYGEVVAAHQQKAVYQQIGNDPNAWFEKQLEERMKDPAFSGAVLSRIQQGAGHPNGSGKPVVRLPPSLNRVASAQAATAEDNDMSDEALFSYATR